MAASSSLLLQYQQTCGKKTKSGGSTRNKKGKTPGKSRGWKKLDGDYVEKGMILFKQLGFNVYPGENVGCGRDLTLFALEPGRVMITAETLSPKPDSPLYDAIKAGRIVRRKFYHVVSEEPQAQTFKLTNQI